jgi:hypothetical protein
MGKKDKKAAAEDEAAVAEVTPKKEKKSKKVHRASYDFLSISPCLSFCVKK